MDGKLTDQKQQQGCLKSAEIWKQKRNTAMIFLFYQSLLPAKYMGEHTLFCRGARADIYGAYFWLNSFESCSFPAPKSAAAELCRSVSMGCWDEVNFKPYKRCHKLRLMANIFLAAAGVDPGHLLFSSVYPQ